MTNDIRFFTNEPERDLYSRFATVLKSNTQFFDVLVGYFRSSGFFNMYKSLETVEKIRILVGLNVDLFTVKIIDLANDEYTPVVVSAKQGKEILEVEIEQEFTETEATSDVEKGVRVFIEWLKNGKLEMRMYTKSPIHAKVYIMRKDPIKVPDIYGSVITGSSNFSYAGLKNNLEFNVELKDTPDVEFALQHFENLWKDGIDIRDAYIEAVEKKTWLRDDITPYELFLKTIYEFFKEEINADTLGDSKWRLSFVRLDYEMKFDGGKFKAKENLTPAKRYSFLVGKDEPCHTAISRFHNFIINKNYNPTLDEIEEAFSVEKVTKEFFDLYCEKFYQLQEYLESNHDFKEESVRCGFTSEQFAKKLMGQIVFLYFLQKKGWLGVNVWTSTLSEKEYKDVFYTSGAQGRIIKEHLPKLYTLKEDGTYHLNSRILDEIVDDDEEVIANHSPGQKLGATVPKTFSELFILIPKHTKSIFMKNISNHYSTMR